jgi:hypothetical protein
LRRYWLFAAILLVIAASRIPRINGFILDNDEIWEVWQTFGNPQQIVQWTSPTETPLYNLTLGVWKSLVGIDPFVVRYLSVLGSMLATAAMYRAIKRLYNAHVALLVTLVYSAFACIIFLSLYTRSYMLTLILWPVAWWLTIRYFDRPTLRRALPLALCIALLYFSQVTTVPALLMLGLYTLVAYPRRLWRWWLPGIMVTLVVLPDILSKVSIVSKHTGALRPPYEDPFLQAVLDFNNRPHRISFFAFFTSDTNSPLLWLLLLGLAVLLILYRRRFDRKAILWLALVLLLPVILYVLEPRLGYYTEKRYAWWYTFPLAVLIGLGLAYLPRAGQAVAVVVIVGLMFVPFPLNDYSYLPMPITTNMKWLTTQIQPDDVFVRDPHIHCNMAEEWDYALRVYFPNGLHFVDNPIGFRRVWYAAALGEEDAALKASVETNRLPGRFVGPTYCFFRVYEEPPDANGVLFGNGMRFHGAQLIQDDGLEHTPTVLREGEHIKLRLWWSVDSPVALDYTVGTYVIPAGKSPIVQQVGPQGDLIFPENAPWETSRWVPGQIYLEERDIQLPYPMSTSDLSVKMGVYFYADNQWVAAPNVDASNLLLLDHIYIKAW